MPVSGWISSTRRQIGLICTAKFGSSQGRSSTWMSRLPFWGNRTKTRCSSPSLTHRLHLRKSGKLVRGRPLQKGITENLLCEGCEQQLSRNEKYVCDVLFGGTQIGIQRFQNKRVYSNLDYTKVRLFFLSLIWRMSVASKHAMWKKVNLGPHEELVRQMVHSKNPGEPWEYGFLCIVPLFNGQPMEDWLLDPDWVRSEWGRMYRLVVGGCLYLFHISNQRLPEQWNKGLIGKDGSWVIPFKDAREIPFILEEAKQYSKP